MSVTAYIGLQVWNDTWSLEIASARYFTGQILFTMLNTSSVKE